MQSCNFIFNAPCQGSDVLTALKHVNPQANNESLNLRISLERQIQWRWATSQEVFQLSVLSPVQFLRYGKMYRCRPSAFLKVFKRRNINTVWEGLVLAPVVVIQILLNSFYTVQEAQFSPFKSCIFFISDVWHKLRYEYLIRETSYNKLCALECSWWPKNLRKIWIKIIMTWSILCKIVKY